MIAAQPPLFDERSFHFHLGELSMGMKVLLDRLTSMNAKLDEISQEAA